MVDSTVVQQTLLTAQASTTVTERVLPLSTSANLLTQFLFHKTALPDVLERYGTLLSIITSGAVAASGVYYFFQQYRGNRAKIQIAVFHVIRMIENLPDLRARLDDPHNLIAEIDVEVSRVIGSHLSNGEAMDVMKELKRKIWTCVDEERETLAKCRRRHTGEGGVIESDVQKQLLLENESRDVTMLDAGDIANPNRTPPASSQNYQMTPCIVPGDHTFAFHGSPSSRQSLPHASPVGHGTYKFASSSNSGQGLSSPTPAPPHKFSGYGLDYEDEDLYSPDPSPTTSTKTSLTEQHRSPLSIAVAKEPADILGRGHDPRVLTKPSSTVKSQPPPNTMAVKTHNQKNGTWLVPIVECASPQASPQDNTPEYRVAESRKYYNGEVVARKERRAVRAFVKQGNKLEQFQQEHIVNASATKVKEWPDAIVSYSSTEEDDREVDIDVVVSSHVIDSPPLAPKISPPLHSPPNEVHTPEMCSPNLPPLNPSALCGANFSPLNEAQASSPIICAVTELQVSTSDNTQLQPVASSPLIILVRTTSESIAPSPPTKKRGRPGKVLAESPAPVTPLPPSKKRVRPRKNNAQPKTPCKRQPRTPGDRKSARSTKFTGAYYGK
ncbi:hypothetical protein CC86DRAFT_31675 [Ophiobolus disseminans]|uniref:Uncharacterized protein n=1 Tax=Ophiobolus disseminans TaxID=1469910 RepID=A0A6A7A1F6_9PLEO|nr:hypothetical protein CC86DRAFT_31675 [Ophiobolus disseminans]